MVTGNALKQLALSFVLATCYAEAVAGGEEQPLLSAEIKAPYAEALALLQPMAEQGDSAAQFNLALMYEHGLGVPTGNAVAFAWYQRAAIQDHSGAQMNLASMYEEGRGVAKSYSEAAKWYRKAARQNREYAQFQLAGLYFRGEGLQQSFVRAFAWYDIASRRPAETKLHEEAARMRDLAVSKMNAAQVSRAQRMARGLERWLAGNER